MKLKIYQIFLIGIFAGLLFTSCKKTVDPTPPAGNGFESLQVPEGFTWSTLDRSHFTVEIVDVSGNSTDGLNGYPLDVTDLAGNLLQRVTVTDGKANYYLELNKAIDEVRLFAPTHEVEQIIDLNIQAKKFQLPANLKSVKAFIDTDGDGVFDDFDDFPTNPDLAYQVFYPSPYSNTSLKSGDDSQYIVWYYQMFEDLWPSKGDYDLNDLIIKLRMVVNFDGSNTWVSGSFDYYIWTNGAALNLGCGMEFFNWVGDDGDKLILEYLYANQITLVPDTYNPAFTMPDPAVDNGIIIFDNADLAKGSDYWNTGTGPSADPMTSHLSFDYVVTPPTQTAHMCAFMYLFYTDDRGHEVRPIGLPPTTGVTWSLLGTVNDASPTTPWDYTPHSASFLYPYDPPFYANSYGHPWGIELDYAGNLSVPFEKVSILDAFPQFQAWAESGGTVNEDWYQFPVADPTKVFDVSSLIPPK